jgi:hypothetical protein
MVSASCVPETAPADTDMLASEPNRSDGRRATGLILERRPNQKATVSDGGNNSIEAGNSSSCTIQISMRPSVYPLPPAGGKWNDARRWCDERSRFSPAIFLLIGRAACPYWRTFLRPLPREKDDPFKTQEFSG